MSKLDKITTSGKIDRNFLILTYGPEKVGKSTFGSELPNPYFICGEDGTDQLNVKRTKPDSWVKLKEVIRLLRDEDHNYKTAVFDTIDWLEQLQLTYLRQSSGVKNIKKIDDGYGAYKSRLKEEWHGLFSLIDELRKKMNICFLAHAQTKKFSDPINSCEYDKYELKMEFPEVSSVFKEYVDGIFFANFETIVKKEKGTKKNRAYCDNTRILYTERTHAFDAGNRYGMPEEMEFSAKEVLNYINQSDEDSCKRLLKEIDEIKEEFTNEEFLKTVSTYVEKVKDKPKKLRSTINKLKIKISEGE